MNKTFMLVAAGLGALGVGLGAFGAHGLAAVLEANGRADTFETATRYLMYHALALLILTGLETKLPVQWLRRAGYLFIAGVIIFSGSLYILAIFNVRFMGAVAPIGGTALIVGWICLGIAAWQKR
ncbi:MAG: hypothetical protein CL610_00440 [Anaerolineaceae bacterium]|nr:hypothetical protein [Anaerolineaceae bacterium]